MTSTSESEPEPGTARARPAREKLRAELRGLPRWKKALLAGAGVFVLTGAGLAAIGDDRPADPPPASVAPTARGDAPATTGTPGRASNFRDGRPTDEALEDVLGGPGGAPDAGAAAGAEAPSPWTPFLLKGGFSFFIGFCVGFALRAFFKISALAVGALALALFLLSYAGVVSVDWETLGGWFDRARVALGEELASFRTFVAGSLPSAATASLGLFSGFKR